MSFFHWWNVPIQHCISLMKHSNPTLYSIDRTFDPDNGNQHDEEFDNLQNRWSIKTKPIADVSHAMTICVENHVSAFWREKLIVWRKSTHMVWTLETDEDYSRILGQGHVGVTWHSTIGAEIACLQYCSWLPWGNSMVVCITFRATVDNCFLKFLLLQAMHLWQVSLI